MIVETSPVRAALERASSSVVLRNYGKLGASIRKGLGSDIGTRQVPSWNAHVSFRTFDTLKKQGVPLCETQTKKEEPLDWRTLL